MEHKELKRLTVVLATILTLITITSCSLLRDYTNYKKAIHAVDAYIEATMDTGEMDEFLESPEGQTYIKYTK